MTSRDGLGQSMLTDFFWRRRFKACQQREVVWHKPGQTEVEFWKNHQQLSLFGDGLFALAEVDEQLWLVVDRIWHGFPDPPEFAFFAVKPNGVIWAGADFDTWPAPWIILETEE